VLFTCQLLQRCVIFILEEQGHIFEYYSNISDGFRRYPRTFRRRSEHSRSSEIESWGKCTIIYVEFSFLSLARVYIVLESVSVKVVIAQICQLEASEIGPCAKGLALRAWVLAAATDQMGDKTERGHSRENAFFTSCKNQNRHEIDKRKTTYKEARAIYIEVCIFYVLTGEQKLCNAKRC